MGHWLRASVVGVAVLTLFISGCAGKAKPISGPAAAQRQVAKTGSALDAIAGRGELRIGVDRSSAPFSSWKENSTSEFEGFAVDVGRRMTQSIFGGKATAKFKPALSDPQSELDQGLYDVLLDPWMIAFAKEEKLHRSPSYFNNSMRFLVRKDEHAAHIQDLSGQQVGSLGPPGFDYEDLKAFLAQQKQESVTFTYVGSNSAGDTVNALIQGNVAAVSGRTSQLASFVKADARLMLLPERWEVVSCSAVVLNQHADLAAAVDKAMQQMIDSGEIAELAKKWGLDI